MSDLNPADAGIIISAMELFLSVIDDKDNDVPPELIPALEKLRAKMEVIPVRMTSFDTPHYPCRPFLASILRFPMLTLQHSFLLEYVTALSFCPSIRTMRLRLSEKSMSQEAFYLLIPP